MEVALVSGALKLASSKLVLLLASEFASTMGVAKDLSELQCIFGEITNWLSAVGHRVTDGDPSFYWLRLLKDIAYDVDDLLYKVHLEAEKHKDGISGDKHVMTNWFYGKPKSALSRLEMAHEIKKIKKRFAKIVKQRTDFNAIATSSLAGHPVRHMTKTIGEMSILVHIDESKVLGRDETKHRIISKLVEAGACERISIVSIIGLGGSGKTTLAKYICQDNKIKEHFEVTFWVHVSQEFHVENLIGKLFETVSDKKSELYTLQHMSRKISEKLSGAKFLLVLDDIWNEDQNDWEQFEQHFNCGAPGSMILLTTRDGKVAEAVKSTYTVNLASLSDDDSWKLFQQSSGWPEEALDSEFIEVGKAIVKNCAGVPLAIKCLAGSLHGKKDIKEWRILRDNNLLTDLDIQGRVSGSLRLSYFQLPDDLKQCFVLCSIFPKGYRIYKNQLISQWISHGFVNPMNGRRQLEDIGSDYFDSLLKVSFIQDLVEDKYTGEVTCKMHDLVHELSRQILQGEIVLTSNKATSDPKQRCRYLSVASCTKKVDRKLFNKVRVLYVAGGSVTTNKPVKKGCCVRSVTLEDISATSVPLFILKFEYLAYLRISYVKCRELPEDISDCWNLQALHVVRCSQFAMLPDSIGNLKKLRTLELSWVGDLDSLPQSIGNCRSLESLHLIKCEKLRHVPDSIAKNEKLRVLEIVNCESLQPPSESIGMLRNLCTINFTGCKSLKDLPISFACDQLHTLKLHRVTELSELPQCIGSLINLEHLDLGHCEMLVELPEGIGNLKRLQVLNIEGCHRLRGLPAGFGQLTRLGRLLGLFVVGDSNEHARISELGNLDRLSGILRIHGIRYVKDHNDAEKACLKKKSNIQKLILNWSSMGNWIEEEVVDMEQELAVLNCLEPPHRINELEILNYEGLQLPHWMTKGRHSCYMDSKFRQIVDGPHFPHLTKMVLNGFYALETISAGPFPSLTEMHISRMRRLLRLSTTTTITLANGDGVTTCGNQEVQCCFPRLTTLHIQDCPKLTVTPWFLPSLEILALDTSNKRLLLPGSSFRPVHPNGAPGCLSFLKKLTLLGMTGSSSGSGWELLCHLTALESLEIISCGELKQLPDSMQSLNSLQKLEISWCDDLCILPEWLEELCSLQILHISRCENLREFPEGIQHLTSLQELHIERCDTLHQLLEVGLGGLLSLRCLWIEKLPSLSCLPQSMQRLVSLQELHIEGCHALQQLPEGLGELFSLRRLWIEKLPGLTCLPQSICGLASLQELHIEGCHSLHQLPERLGELRSLRHLWIDRITCLPESMRGLTSLIYLTICHSDALQRLPRDLGELSSLQTLNIWDLPALTCLPESMQHLTSLRCLRISSCDDLTVLLESIGQLSALRFLYVWNCPSLTSLPGSIQHLAALRVLRVTVNPHLAKRYKREGEDWHLISHIPDVLIE